MPTGSFARATRRDTICSLTTRDPVEKTQVQFIRKMSWTLLSGVIIGMIINMVVLPMWLEKDINGYPILMVSLSINKGVEKALESVADRRARPGCACHLSGTSFGIGFQK